jgi:hypothetical protein
MFCNDKAQDQWLPAKINSCDIYPKRFYANLEKFWSIKNQEIVVQAQYSESLQYATNTLSESSFSTSFFTRRNMNGFNIICKRLSWSARIQKMYHDFVYLQNRNNSILKPAVHFDQSWKMLVVKQKNQLGNPYKPFTKPIWRATKYL